MTLSGTAGATTGTVTEIAPNDGTTYTVAVSGMTNDGTVIADVLANAATDGLGNGNTASTSTDNTVTFDATAPTVTIDQATTPPQLDPTSASPINFAVVFSESVADFDSSDVTVSGTAGATAGTVTGSGTTYNVAISDMTGPGTVVLDIAAGVATDGLGNPNSVATILDNTVTFVVPGEEFQQDSGIDGIVALEAEHADSNTPQGAHSWIVATSVPGFSGDSALAATPNTGINNDTNYAALSPRLDFAVNFVHTGTHYVWIRGLAATTSDDSVHVGLDGQELASSDRIDGFGTSWTWSPSTRDGVVATMQVATGGLHTVNVWMREDGFVLDKVVLTINASFPTPVGEGPPESLQGPPPPLHTLNVTVNGSGSVTSVPSGVACPGTCSVDYTEGTVVILTAVGDSGFGFDGWSGACTDTGTCNMTMDQAQAVTATFSLLPPTPQTLTVTLSGNGTVSSVPGGINCPGTCTIDFPQDTAVTLTAQADPGSVFMGWSGAGCSGMEPCVVPMTQPQNVTATFVVPGAEFQQDSGVDGLVALEAEHADSNTPQGVHSWSVATSVPGFSGDSAMATTPNTGTNNNTNYAALSPRLDFAVNFVHTGTHYVWIRGIGATNLDDSVHVGLDGQELASSDRIDGFGASWTWLQSTRDGVVATMQVDTVGPHTVNVWMREDGVLLDKVVLTINASFPTPVGEGPPESLKGPP